jgi:hypothetical protein
MPSKLKKKNFKKMYIQKTLHEHDDSPEDFRKFVKQKVIERDILKKQKKDKSNKWSITTTIMEENIECDVTIKVEHFMHE